jgi:DNA-binding SARP family transcriptional activator
MASVGLYLDSAGGLQPKDETMRQGTDRLTELETPLWSMTFLGDLAIQGLEVRITSFRTRKAAELLALLALQPGKLFSRDTLVETLWPERDPQASLGQLRVELSSLRKQLEPAGVAEGSVLAKDRSTLRLRVGAISTDVGRFEQLLVQAQRSNEAAIRVRWLRQAVELYGGELLPSLHSDWIEAARQRLAERYEEALLQRAYGLLDLGQRDEAREMARRAVAANPLQEEAHALLIRLYTMDGWLGRARRLFTSFEAHMKDELGVAPSEELRRMVGQY